MVEDQLVIAFLVLTGTSSPMDVGVCVLGEKDGRRAWDVLDRLRREGYVRKRSYGKYEGEPEFACVQRELW